MTAKVTAEYDRADRDSQPKPEAITESPADNRPSNSMPPLTPTPATACRSVYDSDDQELEFLNRSAAEDWKRKQA